VEGTSLADLAHAETCAGRWCNVMDTRANMHRVPGKRGWFCDRCYKLVSRLAVDIQTLEQADLAERLRAKLRARS
jgi:hypothetical protein